MKLYRELAGWFHLLTAPGDYAEEAELYARLLTENAEGPVRTVLELGSGGGNNASHLKRDFRLTLTDLSPEMLAVSRRINPECEHLAGDMRTLRLDRTFDAVFVHDAVMYLATAADLEAAIATAAIHCRPGGVVLLAPDCVAETFHAYVHEGGHTGEGGRALRHREVVTDPDPADTAYQVEFTIRLREADGNERTVHETHRYGLFEKESWLAWMTAAGFDAVALPIALGDPEAPTSYTFVGRRRAGQSKSRVEK